MCNLNESQCLESARHETNCQEPLGSTLVDQAVQLNEVETVAQELDQSFPRDARLLDADGYSRVFKRNRRVTNQHWIILGHRGDNTEARLGLAIAKKRAKRAVDRNKIKRIARESFREKRALLSGIDAVVMNKDAATGASNVELRQSIDTLWLELANKVAKKG